MDIATAIIQGECSLFASAHRIGERVSVRYSAEKRKADGVSDYDGEVEYILFGRDSVTYLVRADGMPAGVSGHVDASFVHPFRG